MVPPPDRPMTGGRYRMPYFLTLLKKVLRGIPRSRAATLLFPCASLSASIKRWRS